MAKKYLILGPSWVGDMVMSQVLYQTIKQTDLSAQIDVICPEWAIPLMSRMPEVSKVLALPFQHGQLKWRDLLTLGRSLRDQGYDHAIVIPRSFKAALIPWLARIPVRTGWFGECRVGLINDFRRIKKTDKTMVQRLLTLGPRLSHTDALRPQLITSTGMQQTTCEKFGLNVDGQRILAICPGAEYGPAKRWPPRYFAEVARGKLAEGWQVWILGSARDIEVAAEIQAATHTRCLDFTGQTTIDEAIDLLSVSHQVISNDSGLMHVASALRIPVVALFGSSDPTYTPPLSDNATVLTHPVPCSPCFKRKCPYQHLDCLVKLLPQQVSHALTVTE